MTKSELRNAIRYRLQTLSPEARAEKSARLCKAIAATEAWQTAKTVGFFSPLPGEPNVELLWAVLGERTVCYPRVVGDDLIFIRVPDRSALITSRWNLLEPPHREDDCVPPGALDLILVPGMAFTADGHRMGRGKGYYDRYLAQPEIRATLFGVAFSEQQVPTLPMESHDIPMTRVFFA